MQLDKHQHSQELFIELQILTTKFVNCSYYELEKRLEILDELKLLSYKIHAIGCQIYNEHLESK